VLRVNLLHPDRSYEPQVDAPPGAADLEADLGLEGIWAAMAGRDPFLLEVVRRVSLEGLTSAQAIRYRQQVLRDCLQHPSSFEELYSLAVAAIDGDRRIWGLASRRPTHALRRATQSLDLLVPLLRRLRGVAEEGLTGLKSEGARALLSTIRSDLDDDYLGRLDGCLQGLHRLGEAQSISARLGPGNQGTELVLRVPSAARTSWAERLGLGERTQYSFQIAPRDDAGLQALAELVDRGVNSGADAVAQAADHVLAFFSVLRFEVGFYLGCRNLHLALSEVGTPLCWPEPLVQTEPGFCCRGLVDAGLAVRTASPPVGNEVDAAGRHLVVVTGANSGGKSTFLRSVGLAQLMLQAGMFVAADSFRATLATTVQTHFVRGEEIGLETGRLDHDLARLAETVGRLSRGALLLLNEPLSGTNEREGSEIARQVISALLEDGVRVVLVTHFFTLADALRATPAWSVLHLLAERLPDGRRTYRIREGEPLASAFGTDLLARFELAWGEAPSR
jgi:hypothetical protein